MGSIGLAGLGSMGFGMATNLLREGFEVTGVDVCHTTLSKFREAGGSTAPTAGDLNADVLICMVMSSAQVYSVLFDEGAGAVHSLPSGAIVLICSTVPASFVASMRDTFIDHGRSDIEVVDCPVSGGTARAAQGTLTILTSGSAEALRRVDPVLRAMSATIYHISDDLGAASNVKMINQLLVGSHIVAAAEAMGLAAKLGLNTREAFEAISQSTGNSWAFNNRVPHMLDDDWTPLSALDIFVKDMEIVTSAARDVSQSVPIASAAQQQYLQGSDKGLGRDDDSGVVRVYLPEKPSLVHHQSRAGLLDPRLTPTATPTEVSVIAVVGALSRSCQVTSALSTAGYSVQRHPAGAQVLLVSASDLEDIIHSSPSSLASLCSKAVIIIMSPVSIKSLEPISSGLRDLEIRSELVDVGDLVSKEEPIVTYSGDDQAVSTILPLLSTIYGSSFSFRRIHGGFGAASKIALINEMLAAVHLACAAEATALGAKLDLDAENLYQIIVNAAGWSRMFETNVPAMLGESGMSVRSAREACKALDEFCALSASLKYAPVMANAARQALTVAASSIDSNNDVLSVHVAQSDEMATRPPDSKVTGEKEKRLPAQRTIESLPAECAQDVMSDVRHQVEGDNTPTLVILDDDPTGTQTCHDIYVLTVWDHETLCEEFRNNTPGFFILTNSRSLNSKEAYELIRTITRNVAKAAEETGKEFEIVLRGDSTLRGHLPQEPEAVEAELGKFDSWVIAPFFYQGGRLTIDDVHYVREGDELVPASETPFAKDASFGYSNSDLRKYVKEKCGARFSDDDFVSVTTEDIRKGGPERVAQMLTAAPQGSAVIVNAAAESDMQVFAAGSIEARKAGKRFLYRTAAAFVSARLGIRGRKPLTMTELGKKQQDARVGGLILAGSYVSKTTAQLLQLQNRRGDRLYTVELDVKKLVSSIEESEEMVNDAVIEAVKRLKQGRDVLIMTSRELLTGQDSDSSLRIGATVAAALVRFVERVDVRPRYIIAKGGITSSDVATKGLRMKRALVLGQAAKGVPLWRCEEKTSKHKAVPLVVFPGNVGGDESLADLVERWSFE